LSKERRYYVPKDFEITFDKLEKILSREGSNISKWIRENAVKYVELHEPGNPQQTLTYILKNGEPYRAKEKERRKGYRKYKNGWIEEDK